MATANRLRDTIEGNNPSAIFEQDQSLGDFLSNCARSIVDSENVLVLSNNAAGEIRLETHNDWDEFIGMYFKGTQPGETDRSRSESLATTLGIALTNFVRLLDDVCATDARREEYDVTRGSPIASLLRIYDGTDSYILGVSAGASAPANQTNSADAVIVEAQPLIGPDIMDGGQLPVEGRDRQEVEAQIDFIFSAGADRTFRENAGNDIWHGLDLRNLSGDFWNDQARMRLIDAYNMPLHLEVNQNDPTGYQLNTSDFLEVYLDTDQRTLAAYALSIRTRVRPDQGNRGLLQMKEELAPDPITGRPVREKWERQNWGAPQPDLDGLVEVAQTGRYQGQVLASMQKLYKKLVDKGAIPVGGTLRLRPDHVIFQRRTRTHLRLDSLDTLSDRYGFLQQEAAARNPVPPTLAAFLSKVETQLQIMEAAEDAMLRAINRRLPSEFDAVIISFDRWSAFEPSAYERTAWPENLGDPGRRGRGLRVETELDAFTSEPFENALEFIDRQLQGNPPNRMELEQDRAAIHSMQAALFEDVATTARLMARRMEDAGLDPIVNPFASKSESAMAMLAEGQGGFRHGHRFWV